MKQSMISRVFRNAIAWIGLITVLFLLGLSLFSTSYIASGSSEKSYLLKDSAIILLLIAAAVMGGMIVLKHLSPLQKAGRKINDNPHLFHLIQAILLGVTAAGSLVYLFSVQAVPGQIREPS